MSPDNNRSKHYRIILIYIGVTLILTGIGVAVTWLVLGHQELEPISVILMAIGGLILTIVSLFTNSE